MHEVVYPNDVRMCQFEATFCLAPELVERGTIVNHQVGKKFERDIALQFFVARKPDYSHSASPEDLDQRVRPKTFCPPENSREVAYATPPARSRVTLQP